MNNKPPLTKIIEYFLNNKLVAIILLTILLGLGITVAPFEWNTPLPKNPIPVDAIPDIGENQQIVFTNWSGKSPQDIEDQITYPLTVALLGIPEVKTVRSYSMFGFSTIYIIFKEKVDFYWSRSRILERLNSLSPGSLPDDVKPQLGPDATALGQIYWYTLEGRDEEGNPTGGWDLQELRSIQDWYVKYGLQSAEGISEVASVGGHIKEYQIDVNPGILRQNNISLSDIFNAVKNSNIDVGARTIEINRAEYIIRGLGYIQNLEDIENTAIIAPNNIPIYIKDVGNVTTGPAIQRGVLDKEGAEAVGGVAVVRYGYNPLRAIKNLKQKIEDISPGLPSKILPDGRISKVTIVPFYDRSGLINETLGTLNHALRNEILVTIIVILIMIMHFKSSLLISGLLPITVLMVFINMKFFGVDANIVALSGIAIAIGTIVDMGIVITENILRHMNKIKPGEKSVDVISKAVSEVAGAVMTAVATTVVGFLPVFAMEAAEGKLFKPLAYTKTFALISSVIIVLIVLPAFAHILFKKHKKIGKIHLIFYSILIITGLFIGIKIQWLYGLILISVGLFQLSKVFMSVNLIHLSQKISNWIFVVFVGIILSNTWAPMGHHRSIILNFLFIFIVFGSVMGVIKVFTKYYPILLRWTLDHKIFSLSIPSFILLFGISVWVGFGDLFSFLPNFIKRTKPFVSLNHKLPGLGKEFMPPLDEGSFLYMPTTMAHAGVEESHDVLRKLDMALYSVPEVETVVGKIGRADTPLDPAPISMVETVVNYKSEYILDDNGNRMKFKTDKNGNFIRDNQNNIIPDKRGKPFRQWREHIRTNQDIWDELIKVAQIPGTTSAPKLQPISARLVMLQSGMRAPMGIKVKGPNLNEIENFGLKLEKILKDVPSIAKSTVFAERIVGKPYLEINIDRLAIAQYGMSIKTVQNVIEVAIGGKSITKTVEGRERYNIRVRYLRELRDNIGSIGDILVPTPSGSQIPLDQLSEIKFVKGPQVIKSEDTFLIGYVLFDKEKGFAEVDVVEQSKKYIEDKISNHELIVPPGISFTFAGSYENQIRASKKLSIILPLSLLIIFMILYFQFKKVTVSLIVFSGIFISWAGGFTMLWFYGQEWFLNFNFAGVNMQKLFQIHPINLSVAVWVGFLALFGIASDDGVIMSTYLEQTFKFRKPKNIKEIRDMTVLAGSQRIRPAMMTISTTILALIPVLTSTGRGADIMVPMAIPTFGGMSIGIITTFVVPILYTINAEYRFNKIK
ncbi:MAG: efflux RND transporter permease subunit [Candidatus Marinimicrobia bacterium]|jgi:Cu(I)/Ag(I) efflux system membrane protein CusA/SilA|nr:efflux RND transporter permease subunit [Candidatus Neomarinimicrobiota bacterium]